MMNLNDASFFSESNTGTEVKETKIDGYLYKLEQRPILGLIKQKYWFILPNNSPVLYWYKSPNDFNCMGRIVLSGAAFTFNPRDYGTFEIHVDKKCYLLEAPNNKLRLDWLSALQSNRKQYYLQSGNGSSREGKDYKLLNKNFKLDDVNQNELVSTAVEPCSSSHVQHFPSDSDVAKSNLFTENEPKSVFYLSEEGELHPRSFDIPPPIYNIQAIEDLFGKVADGAQQLEIPTKKLLHKKRSSLRTHSQSTSTQVEYPNLTYPQPRENCDRCPEFVQILDQLRSRCYELTDDLVVYQDLVASLKRSVMSAHNEKDALQRYCVDAISDMDKLAFVIEREHAFTRMQFTVFQLRTDIETLKAENRRLEAENCSLNTTVEAYQESVKTKEALILRFVEQQQPQTGRSMISPSTGLVTQGIPARGANRSIDFCTSPEVPEALLVDFGTPTDVAAKNVFTETAVNDLNEMQDLIDGYRNQNRFLNNEVLELQRIIHSLEDRERRLIRQNFSIEAVYYQLKSKYIMLLNHFRSSSLPTRVIEPLVIEDLIHEVLRPHSPMRMHNTNSLAVEKMKSPSAISTLISQPDGIPIAAYEDLRSGLLRHCDSDTDSLGFYLSSPRSRKELHQQAKINADDENAPISKSPKLSRAQGNTVVYGDEQIDLHAEEPQAQNNDTKIDNTGGGSPSSSNADDTIISTTSNTSFNELSAKPSTKSGEFLLRMAADSQKRSDEILTFFDSGDNKEFVDWLQRWDAFLVKSVLQPMSPNPQLKALVRCGIPHAYRQRVWTGLVDFLVGPTQVETGKGYYECLLRKAQRLSPEEDAALKQIDLDLARTLPNNKLFETEQSPKAGALKNILYAFRFHNKSVEYCQGLNRIAAIGLLYLDEPQAFWFLVACVEHLQPPNYYSSNLVGAVIDQRVLLDLVQDKMPLLYGHLHKLQVNLSLFTLSWFLTIFVDVLPHTVYIKIFDVFLHEGNKVLFRFALAILKLVEPNLLECVSFSGVHTCLGNLSSLITDYRIIAKIAFNSLNPFPSKFIESKRHGYYLQHKNGKFKM